MKPNCIAKRENNHASMHPAKYKYNLWNRFVTRK
jgi:hypothetical protein